jgi:hypothetical protein
MFEWALLVFGVSIVVTAYFVGYYHGKSIVYREWADELQKECNKLEAET